MNPAPAAVLVRVAIWALPALLAACAAPRPAAEHAAQPAAACPPCPACPTAAPSPVLPPAAPLQPAGWQDVAGWSNDDPAGAWPALRESCRTLAARPSWSAACEAAQALGERPSSAAARAFFESQFQPWQVTNPDGSREGLITGYYEPRIKGSRTRSARYAWPVYGVPSDLLTIDFGDVYPELKNMRLRGRVVGNRVVPYWSRADIDRRGELPARVLLWAADPLDLFFLQVQGSGRVDLPDGGEARIGYADQNGHPYQSIGRWLVAHGELALDQASMEGIRNWARTHPDRVAELLDANPSYVFFRELPPGPAGPIGASGAPLSAGRSLAIDPRVIPLGAPVFLATTWPLESDRPLDRLMVAQDTGGAIKGAVRADVYWGSGEEAGRLAGKMRQQGRMWVLLPRGMRPD